jgi:hypothetical protein
MNRKNLLLSVVALSAVLLASPAEARSGSQSSGSGVSSLSLWGVLDPGPVDGAGAGFRLAVPIVPQGILHARVRDELVLEPGMDYVHYSDRFGYPGGYYWDYSWNGVLAVCGVAWNFWLTPQFALYPKLDIGWWFGWYSHYDNRWGPYYHDFDGGFLQLAGGLIYRLPSRFDLRVEAGSGLLRLGIGIPF